MYNNPPPAGEHSYYHQQDPNRFVQMQDREGFYHWERKPQLSPGAMAYAFESLGLSEYSPVGCGIVTRQPMRVTTPNVYFSPQYTSAGLGGLVTGTMALQSLIDPYNGGYGV